MCESRHVGPGRPGGAGETMRYCVFCYIPRPLAHDPGISLPEGLAVESRPESSAVARFLPGFVLDRSSQFRYFVSSDMRPGPESCRLDCATKAARAGVGQVPHVRPGPRL